MYLEYGLGGREVDDATRQPHEVPTLRSHWGIDPHGEAVDHGGSHLEGTALR